MQSLEIIRDYDVVLCDIDGVLHVGAQAIDGVPEFLQTLLSLQQRVLFLTNNGTALPEQILRGLSKMGLELGPDRLITAGQVLEAEFPKHSLLGKAILSIGNEAASEYIRRAGGTVIEAAEARKRYPEAAAVVIGSSRELDKDVLDASCNAVYRHQVPVFCTNPDVFTPTGQGEITLVAGAIANMFERELGIEVTFLGKPHPPIFELALQRLARDVAPDARVLVIDDNMASGISGGHRMGFDTMLVLSGYHRNLDEAKAAMQSEEVQPTYVLDSVVSQ